MRVNIEARAFVEARLSYLSRLMGWDSGNRQALGMLALLWHDSQEALAEFASKEDIILWCRPANEAEGEQIFSALLKTKYISETRHCRTTKFRIHGNAKQVAIVKSKRAAGKAGGIASGKARNSGDFEANGSQSGTQAKPSQAKPKKINKKSEGASGPVEAGPRTSPEECTMNAEQIRELVRKGLKSV